MTPSIFKKAIIATLAFCAVSFAFDKSIFEPGHAWGWGGDASYEAQVLGNKPASLADSSQADQSKASSAEATLPKDSRSTKNSRDAQRHIPFFDEYVGNLLLQKDFKTLTNADSIRTNLRRFATAHGTIYSRSAPTEATEKIHKDVYVYMSSLAWENDLQKLDSGDAAFVRAIVYTSFMSDIVNNRYIQILIDRITDIRQRTIIEDLFGIKPTRTVLKANHWYLMYGIDGDFFSNGANEKINPGPAFNLGFGYCLVGTYCGEFRIGSMFTSPYKEDVIQSGITYPKEHISYSAVEALLRVKLVYAFDYDISVFGGLRLHALEFDTEKDKEFKEDYGKGMANSYSFGYTAGISGAKFFAGNGTTPKLFGIGVRAGFANFGESKFDVTGFNWYVGVDVRASFSVRP